MLRQLGWITTKSGRKNPRNNECTLAPLGELHRMHRELLSSLDDPIMFMKRIFGTTPEEWVERCPRLVKERSV